MFLYGLLKMEKELLNQEIKNEILEIAHYLLKFPKKKCGLIMMKKRMCYI